LQRPPVNAGHSIDCMKRQRFYISLMLLSLFPALAALGQRAPVFGGGGQQQTSGQGNSGSNVVLDTSRIYYFFTEAPHLLIPFSDSLLESFHQYDHIRRGAFDQAHLGNLGSAHRPLFFQPTFRQGFDVGFHQFDLYPIEKQDVRFYKITQAFTHATYTQGPTLDDAQFLIRFSRNFADGLNLSIEHRRINNQGAYDQQQATNSSVAAGLWYHSKWGHYDGFLSFITNSIQQQDNGGAAESLTDTLVPPFQVLVNLRTANTRHAHRELSYTHYLYLNKMASAKREKRKLREEKRARSSVPDSLKIQTPPDSTLIPTPAAPNTNQVVLPPQNTSRAFTLYHQFAWKTSTYKFSDTQPDSAFYGDFWVDSRGLRHYLETRKLENTFKLQTFKLKRQGAETRESDLLEAGLVHSLHLIEQEPVDTSALHNLFLTGRLNFSPGERLRIRTYAHLGIANNTGDYRLNGELHLDFKKIGKLRLSVVNQLYSPSLLHHRLFISQREFWKRDLGKTLETSLSGTYSLPAFHFSATGQYHLVNNLVWFDTAGISRQTGAVSILQLMVQKDFHLGILHSENWVGIQETTSGVLRLPKFYSKHSLYLQRKIFKKVMLAKVGLDARFTFSYTPPTYQPLTGQFQLQNEQTLPFTPLVDAFVSFQVKTFRFFFKTENVLPVLTGAYYFQTAGYPMAYGFSNGGSRFGISWRLMD
jgi:hypothetical protein